nr:MAG TPA: hypothetical protein [Caudoviricetes sp.]
MMGAFVMPGAIRAVFLPENTKGGVYHGKPY